MVWTGMILVHKKGRCGKRPTGTASDREVDWTILGNDGSREPLPTNTLRFLLIREINGIILAAYGLPMSTYLYYV
jgi:hypothetical protein